MRVPACLCVYTDFRLVKHHNFFPFKTRISKVHKIIYSKQNQYNKIVLINYAINNIIMYNSVKYCYIYWKMSTRLWWPKVITMLTLEKLISKICNVFHHRMIQTISEHFSVGRWKFRRNLIWNWLWLENQELTLFFLKKQKQKEPQIISLIQTQHLKQHCDLF